MKFPVLRGWKMWAWSIGSAAWSIFYLFFARLMAGVSVGGANEGLMFIFNWLFPVGLLYLVLTIGKRR